VHTDSGTNGIPQHSFGSHGGVIRESAAASTGLSHKIVCIIVDLDRRATLFYVSCSNHHGTP
jgi:hypothetical protein